MTPFPLFSQNEFARHDESCPPVFLSHWMNHCLGRPYAYEFNDLSKGPGRKLRKESLLVGLVVPPAVPGRASVQSCRFYLDMAQNEGVRPSVLKTKLSVHFGARSSVGSFTDDESPLAILYSSPPAVLSFWLGGAEQGSITLCRKCIDSPRSKPRPCVRRTYRLRIIGSPTPGRVCEPCNRRPFRAVRGALE